MLSNAAQGNDPRTCGSLPLVCERRIFGRCKETTDGIHIEKLDDQHIRRLPAFEFEWRVIEGDEAAAGLTTGGKAFER